jgi:PPK2 family polyphosphate:nucleotide phosphotransferase
VKKVDDEQTAESPENAEVGNKNGSKKKGKSAKKSDTTKKAASSKSKKTASSNKSETSKQSPKKKTTASNKTESAENADSLEKAALSIKAEPTENNGSLKKKTSSKKTKSPKQSESSTKVKSSKKTASSKASDSSTSSEPAAQSRSSKKSQSKKNGQSSKKNVSSNNSPEPRKIDNDTIHRFIQPYKVTNGKNFKLSDFNPEDTGPLSSEDKDEAKLFLQQGIEILGAKQDILYAQDRYAMLLVFQAMDAAGKDSTIKHVMSGVNPQGCQVYSFKQPSAEELDHDYMWRYARCLPERGRIGIYNRSYYEEVLVVRVHEEILATQRLPYEHVTKNIFSQRLEDIAAWEDYLHRQGIVVLKFFLNVSKREQKKRFLARLDRPEKHWKFTSSDLSERNFWNDYQNAYAEAIKHTATKESPWYVVPADNKWYTRLVVAAAIADTMNNMNLAYPPVDKAKMKEVETAKITLAKSEKA